MNDNYSAMAVAIKALEDKCVRLNESDISHEDIIRMDSHVVILRGRAAEVFDCLFHPRKNSVPAHHLPDGGVGPVASLKSGVESGNLPVLERADGVGVVHGGDSFSLPNEKMEQPPLTKNDET